jgi:hypothetical protein
MNEAATDYGRLEVLEVLEIGETIPKAEFDLEESDLYQIEEWESANDWPTYP